MTIANELPKPPVAKREPHPTHLHGRVLDDDYFWMRNKGAPEVLSHLEAENVYAAEMTRALEPRVQALYEEMLARIKQDDDTPPVKDGAWRYYVRFETGKQYPVYCRKSVTEPAAEVVMLDVNELAKTEKFVDVAGADVSDDGHLLAHRIDTVGFRQYTLKVKDLRTNALLGEAIERVVGSAWTFDNATLFYVTEDPQTKRPNKLFRHVVGEPSDSDELVYEELDEMFNLEVGRTRDKAFIIVTSASHTTTETRVISAADPRSPPLLVAPRQQDHEYYVDHRAGLFYIRTNDRERNFRLVTAPVGDPRPERWTEVLPGRGDVMLEDVSLFEKHMVVRELKGALPQLSIYDFATNQAHTLEQADAIYSVHAGDNPEFDATIFRYSYESPVTPSQVIDYDTKTRTRTIVKQKPVLGGFDPTQYETKRIEVVARDGTRIPVSLAYRKGTVPDGTHPLYLGSYGAYGATIPLYWSSTRLSLLDRGVVWAHAHIRGGGDLGKRWHDAGRMATKMNTFTDFIDVADALMASGWAKRDGLVAEGGSAGGLLMGAVANMRPELFRVILAHVPFVDVVNTMLDETLPLTVAEFEEWGNPKKKAEFDVIASYSPYDNVKAQAYPAMLVRTSYHDSQVMYWEPAKWVAKLRTHKTNTEPLLLKIELEGGGHGGQSGRFDRLRDTAFDFAFMFSQLGL